MAARNQRKGRSTQAKQVGRPNGQPEGRDHLVLVPGFGGFDALGSMRYYYGVHGALSALDTEQSGNPPFSMHYFPNLPTASVQTRARKLRSWLRDQWDEDIFQGSDRLHLIGHSTGGLDIRQLLTDYRIEFEEDELRNKDRKLLETITSVQFLSTPHQGTALVRHWWLQGVFWLAMNGSYHLLRLAGEKGSSQVAGRLGKLLFPKTQTADWVDAVVDTLSATYTTRGNLECAEARERFFILLNWLRNAASDSSALRDLDCSKPGPGAPASPAHLDKDDEESAKEVRFLDDRHIAVRSYVSRARQPSFHPTSLWPLSLLPFASREGSPLVYLLAWSLTAHSPSKRLEECTVRGLLDARPHTLAPSDNDGIVNSVSQVWPDEERSILVEGDHADVIGHFQSPPARQDGDSFASHQYDLLGSESDFNQETFNNLWREVGRFALSGEAERQDYLASWLMVRRAVEMDITASVQQQSAS